MATVAPASAQLPRMVWVPCPECWGQRRIFGDRNGEGLVPCACARCIGIGEIPLPAHA
jgi:hypothetical protein